MMKPTLTILSLALLAAASLHAGCAANPCDDLQAYAVGCQDPTVVAVIDRIIQAGDKDTCRQYRDAWGVTFQPRCLYPPDSGTPDGSTSDASSDGGPTDASSDGGLPDASVDGGLPDAYYDVGPSDALFDGPEPSDSGTTDAPPDGGPSDAGADSSSD